jgi:hypothetical protein
MDRQGPTNTQLIGSKRRGFPAALALGLATTILAGACTGGGATSSAAAGRSQRMIPQPVVRGLETATESARVDLALPTFSDPTNVTNPLFPVSRQASVLMLGHVDGQPFRTEVTLLPETRVIDWEGQRVETLVSQYNAYLGGRIEEVAYDYYAQADDGSVWYFGEDVFDFRDGAIVVTEGTWLAGRDGPAAMIMPGRPQIGDVYRPENAPGFVFEEVTVTSVGQTLQGPTGPIVGGLKVEELHSDGSTEDKTFAPGYGEFFTGSGGDMEALALAVPTDAAAGPMPSELTTLTASALEVFEAAGPGRWGAATRAMGRVTTAWTAHRAANIPRLIRPVMEDALHNLQEAMGARQGARAREAAIEVARSGFDLQLQYRPPAEIDLARMDLWAAQLLVDAAARKADLVAAAAYALDYVRDRIREAVPPETLTRINEELGAIQVAVKDEEIDAAAKAAGRLRAVLASVRTAG